MWKNPQAIRELLQRNVTDFPDREALVSVSYRTRDWIRHTWNEMDEVSDRLAAILDMGEEKGLVLNTGNSKDIDFLCLCCHCCCNLLKMLSLGGKPGEQVQSSFYAAIYPEGCTACGTCKERCQINAVIEGDTYEIDTSRCIGCGVCLSTCPAEAITLIAKPESEISDTWAETLQQIRVERGVT
jgi:electron transport complex protein RnfB